MAQRVTAERGVDRKQARGVIEAALKAVVDVAIAQRSIPQGGNAGERPRGGGAEVNLTGFGHFKV